MREIKFRAIDRDSCKFVYSDDNELDSFWYGYSDGQYKTEPEQFTGLRDKNGKEVYENDIMKGDYSGGRIGVIQFARGIFGVNWDYITNNDPEWTGGNMYGSWGHLHNLRPLDDDHITHMIVIGNIHENPELL